MRRRDVVVGLAALAACGGPGTLPVAPPAPGPTIDVDGVAVELVIEAGRLGLSRDDLVGWVRECIAAMQSWYGRFPVDALLVDVTPGPGRGVRSGKAYGRPRPRVYLRIGENATLDELRGDWVFVHELVHLAFPMVADRHDWIHEGLSTYIEPWIRVGCGQMSAARAWADLMAGLPKGQPRAGDRGLDNTPTWGRTYWGGALWALVVDVAVREQTGNRVGLQDAMRAIVAAGGNMAQVWDLERCLQVGDAATGTTVLTDQWRRMADTPVTVDLDALWARLGVVAEGRGARLVDDAPLAGIRRGITQGVGG